jgi:hypothetical protein
MERELEGTTEDKLHALKEILSYAGNIEHMKMELRKSVSEKAVNLLTYISCYDYLTKS